ncbi:MAG: HvfX family Cu-binding RiPP maturation protein [Nevskiales bacterium]
MQVWLRHPIRWLDTTRVADFIAPFLLRLYLVPIFWMAGMSKYDHFDSTVEWFGNPEWGLGLPFPWLMAFLATATELIGAVCLALGLGLRIMCVPLMVTMLVAVFSVHWEQGWLAIAESGSPASMNLMTTLNKLQQANPEIYEQLLAYGKPVVLNNGIEFAATYFLMLLTLFFVGAGRYISIDYWIRRYFHPEMA